ncbi:hypothetical protein GQ43DRAFT_476344 [Delitschia confertaspora ATCC 74209]|uniref:EthD domain-containing protein n=1 Tax=Delitschia confertaspora ATCC 74209 TaxID=1513339 RepID=A0A9P4MMS5_9PLEO|nr:hypothetical protein GQ43DRAFT_476344 [Delitschia confertaspora ATCC 74209]
MSQPMDSPPCPNHTTHSYRFDEVKLGCGSNEQPYFRALVFFYKKPGLTDEFFHEHWKSVHADLTLQTKDLGVNLGRYTQLHMEPKHREGIQPLLQASGGTMQLVPWDGCGKRFADIQKGYHIMCGYENLILGSSIPGLGGKDGILVSDSRVNGS